MVDLKGDLEDKFARLMETMSHHDNGGTSGSRESRMTEGNPSHATGYRGDQENPFATNPVPAKNVKLDFPRFYGGDPTDWVSKVDQYFDYHETPHGQLVRFTSYHHDGVANRWWQATARALCNDRIPIT